MVNETCVEPRGERSGRVRGKRNDLALKTYTDAADRWLIEEDRMSHERPGHTVRRIVLPSGRAIEVVRFDESDEPGRPLHVCPACASPLVQPTGWSETPRRRWELELECPNCHWSETGVFDREQVERFEDLLDEG